MVFWLDCWRFKYEFRKLFLAKKSAQKNFCATVFALELWAHCLTICLHSDLAQVSHWPCNWKHCDREIKENFGGPANQSEGGSLFARSIKGARKFIIFLSWAKHYFESHLFPLWHVSQVVKQRRDPLEYRILRIVSPQVKASCQVKQLSPGQKMSSQRIIFLWLWMHFFREVWSIFILFNGNTKAQRDEKYTRKTGKRIFLTMDTE